MMHNIDQGYHMIKTKKMRNTNPTLFRDFHVMNRAETDLKLF